MQDPSCKLTGNDCAHEAGKYIPGIRDIHGDYQRKVNGMLYCSCGLPLRAKEVREWALPRSKNQGSTYEKQGFYIVYEERKSDG